MNSPIQTIKTAISQGKTPQQIIQNMLNNNNPMAGNLIQMAQKGDRQGVETFARNLLKERGRDFDKEFNDFMSNFK